MAVGVLAAAAAAVIAGCGSSASGGRAGGAKSREQVLGATRELYVGAFKRDLASTVSVAAGGLFVPCPTSDHPTSLAYRSAGRAHPDA